MHHVNPANLLWGNHTKPCESFRTISHIQANERQADHHIYREPPLQTSTGAKSPTVPKLVDWDNQSINPPCSLAAGKKDHRGLACVNFALECGPKTLIQGTSLTGIPLERGAWSMAHVLVWFGSR